MKKEDAYNIAEKHVKEMNPQMWNGKGRMPKSFDARIITYPLTDGVEMDISFEVEKDPDTGNNEWMHYCELRDTESEDCLTPLHGYGVDSVNNLADTIMDVCDGYELATAGT